MRQHDNIKTAFVKDSSGCFKLFQVCVSGGNDGTEAKPAGKQQLTEVGAHRNFGLNF